VSAKEDVRLGQFHGCTAGLENEAQRYKVLW